QEATSSAQLLPLYRSIGRSLERTWELRYATAARPGESVVLEAAVAGAGRSTRGVVLPGTPPPLRTARPAWTSRLDPLALAGAVFVLMLCAVVFALGARRRDWLASRLDPHVATTRRAKRTSHRGEARSLLKRLFAATERAFANVKQFRSLQRMLVRADLPLLAAELVYLCLGCAIATGVVAGVSGASAFVVLVLVFLGGWAPILFVAMKARSRIRAFDEQLPDLLTTIAASLKAGHSFRHSIQSVVDEGGDPAAKEFRRVLTETRLGRQMDDALSDLSTRIGSKNLSFALTAVTIQRQIGGSLAGLFDMVADTVRQRQQFARKIRALTAMGRMSAYVLIGLPFLVAVAVSAINSSYMGPLWHTTTGHELVGAGLVMIAVGSLILRKIVTFRG
ncbi:MAG: type II secretion system F family protein, partial [Actinobacteria bacterium]|nr:type II secretion system F family protein [Actinomycetota bacterium]